MSETDTRTTRGEGAPTGSRRTRVPFLRDRSRETLADQERFLTSYANGKVAGSASALREKLGPLVKRHVFHIPANATIGVGWAQLPRLGGASIALGIFTPDGRFSQVALADWHGRVFLAPPPVSEAAGLDVSFTFLPENTRVMHEEGEGSDRESEPKPAASPRRVSRAGRPFSQLWGRFSRRAQKTLRALNGTPPAARHARLTGMASNPMAELEGPLPADAIIHGAMLSALDVPDNDPRWVASWTQQGGRYNLQEMKMPLPRGLRENLGYRDAVAIGFFAAGYLPLITGFPEGYGSGAVFRLLREQAPMAALKNTIAVITTTARAGYRVSGLDRFFVSLPRQLGFLNGRAAPLLPRHGLEPLALTTSAYSRAFMLHSRVSQGGQEAVTLNMVGEFEALRLESALNRFSLVSALLETNAITGLGPVEETADEQTASRMDRKILRDPVLTALPIPGSLLWRGQRTAFDEGGNAAFAGRVPDVPTYILHAGLFARATTDHLLEEEKKAGRPSRSAGEWVYRQSLSRLYEMLRLPLRSDIDFRSSLKTGRVAVEMGAVESGLLPDQLYAGGHYIPASREDKKILSARESLEQGLLLASLAFGASSGVKSVTLLVTDNRLTDYVRARRMQPGPGLLDRLGLTHHRSAKGEAKDKDRHGDPETTPIVPDGDPFTGDSLSHAVGDEVEEPRVTSEGTHKQENDQQPHTQTPQNASRQSASTDSNSPATSPGRQQEDDGADDTAANAASEILAAATPDTELPEPVRLVTVTFTREKFRQVLADIAGKPDPDLLSVYRRSGAVFHTDRNGALLPAPSSISLRDLAYTPSAAQEEPEAAQRVFDARARRVLAAKDSLDLSIQREEVLQTAVDYVKQLHREEQAGTTTSVEAAKKATAFLDRIADPELETVREPLIRSLIDRTDVPDITFEDEDKLRSSRLELLQSAMHGVDLRKAVDNFENILNRYDNEYRSGPGVPRFFNSYAERVVYNHLFATPGERTLNIPDDLFYGHILLADAFGNGSETQAALRQLNIAVSYAPSYAMVHLRQSVQYARGGDWTSARAACLNALNVAVDRLDAGYAYYRLAYAEWQLDRLQAAAACYQTALLLGQTAGGALPSELGELTARMRLQGIEVPQSEDQIHEALAADSIVVWPDRQISTILREATHVTVDEGMFIPARTIARAWTRVNRSTQGGIDMVQARFLHSLEA